MSSLGNFFTVNTNSENKNLEFVLPKQRKSITTSKEKIILVEQTGEREISFVPDREKAETEKNYFLSYTPFVTEEKTVFPNLERTAAITTETGDAETTVTLEQTKESWLSAFSHKIPLIIFIIIAFALLLLSFVKKLSLIPILGLLSCLYLMTELGITNWLRFGIWLIVGMLIYFFYGYRHSKLNQTPDATGNV